MCKVSVVMPVYNGEKYLKEAIDSILNQTYTDFEFIIINDGSTDSTKEIIQSFEDQRIVVLENEKNLGIVSTLNRGLDCAVGEYIARMDADDIAEKGRLEKQVNTLDGDSTIGVLGTGTRVFGDDIEDKEMHSTLNPNQLKAELIFSSCICHPSVMIRKKVLDEFGIRYKEEYKGAEDYEMWWQIAAVSKIASIPDILHNYRIHKQQITQTKDEAYKQVMVRMLELKLKSIQLKLSDNEKQCFMIYCLGNFKEYELKEMQVFINVLYKILENNRQDRYFEQKSLRKVLALAITFAYNNSQMTEKEKRSCYRYAIRKGIYPFSMRIKLFVRIVLKGAGISI